VFAPVDDDCAPMENGSAPAYWFKNAAYMVGLPLYAALLRGLSARARSDAERLSVARKVRFRGFSVRPYQVDEEILELLEELKKHSPRRLVEIGTAQGGTLFLMLRSLARTSHLVSIDLPHGPFGGGYAHWKIPLFHSMSWGGPRLTLLRGSSQTTEMRDRVGATLGGPADFVLIDGDHSYAGAKRDFELYRDIVAPGGLVAFHDIVSGKPEKVGGVPALWQELKARYRYKEFVRDWKQGGFGIGLLYL
jgi:predicted O-methyltransferase YrrM